MSDNTTPNKPPYNRMNDSQFDDSESLQNKSTGNFTASKITHVSLQKYFMILCRNYYQVNLKN